MELIEEKSCRSYGIVTKSKKDILAFHWHNTYELLHIMDNPCSVMVDAKLLKVNKGDIVVVPPKTAHRLIIENDNTNVRIFQFPKEILISGVEALKDLKRHITFEEIKKADNLLKTLESLFCVMDEEREKIRMQYNPCLNFLSATVYYLLMRHFAVSDGRKNVKDGDVFLSITEYINENYTSKITVEKIAAQFYMSRKKLNTIFSKYAGISLTDYIISLRLKKANSMLKEGLSVTETALSCGFGTIRTFNNIYKNYMNMSPTEYVKKERGKEYEIK